MPGSAAIYKPTPFHLLGFATAFAMVGICTGLALHAGVSPLAVVTLRTLGTLAVLSAYFAYAGISFALERRAAWIAVAIGLPLCFNNYLINAAMVELPVPLVVLIFYLWPAVTSAVSWATGRERFQWRGVAALVLAFAGIALALDADFTATQMTGVWFALGAALNWSAVFLLTGHFFRGRDTRTPTLYMVGTAAVIFMAACAVGGEVTLPASTIGWLPILGTALFYSIGMIGIFTASARIGAARTGFFMNFEPIASVLLAAAILGQTLSPLQLAGAALVVGALFLFRPPA